MRYRLRIRWGRMSRWRRGLAHVPHKSHISENQHRDDSWNIRPALARGQESRTRSVSGIAYSPAIPQAPPPEAVVPQVLRDYRWLPPVPSPPEPVLQFLEGLPTAVFGGAASCNLVLTRAYSDLDTPVWPEEAGFAGRRVENRGSGPNRGRGEWKNPNFLFALEVTSGTTSSDIGQRSPEKATATPSLNQFSSTTAAIRRETQLHLNFTVNSLQTAN
jgi:hypothetical protein